MPLLNYKGRNKIITMFFCILPFFQINARNFTLEEVTTNSKQFTPKTLKQLQWIGDTEYFSYVAENKVELIGNEIYSGHQTILLTLDEINVRLNEMKLSLLDKFPKFKWHSNQEIIFWHSSHLLIYNLSSKIIQVINKVPSEAENIDYINPRKVAYTLKNNLYISIDGEFKQVTYDLNPSIVNGKVVHRSEFGISKGIFWSPKQNYLAFYKKDESMVEDYPLVDFMQSPVEVKNIKYPMAGRRSHEVQVGLYHLKSGHTTWIKREGLKDDYMAGLTWGPDEEFFYFNHINRQQNENNLYQVNVDDGSLEQVLFHEKSDKYVEPMGGPHINPINPTAFLFESRTNGWSHLFDIRISAKGYPTIKQITKGSWEITNFDGFDHEGQNVFFTSTNPSPLERHYYRLNLITNHLEPITSVKGTHEVIRSAHSEYFLDTYSNGQTPYQVDLLNSKGELIRTVYKSKDVVEDIDLGKTEIIKFKAQTGEDLYGRLTLPPSYNPKMKYPVIYNVYGGPHAQLITEQWLYGMRLWDHYMAQKGYIIFSLDNRGSYNRGQYFEQYTHRNLGEVELQDQIEVGVNFLLNRGDVDVERMGVFGWSFGGFMSLSLMTRTPGYFKAAVAGGAVIDWKLYEIMYTERYMGTPDNNPEGFRKSNLLNYIDHLDGKLLLVHGTHDDVVVWQHTMQYAKKAAGSGVEIDYFPYHGHGHHVLGQDKFHLYQKITDFFEKNL